MKKVCVSYRAVIDREFEIPDELYESIKNKTFDWRAFEELFERASTSKVWLTDMQSVENANTGECIYED